MTGTGVVAATVAGAAVLSSCNTDSVATSDSSDTYSWDYEADVVIIGAGGAGLPAGLKAMEDGSSVLFVEAAWDVGGHAAMSGGYLHSGTGTDIQKKYDIEDSVDQYYIDHTSPTILDTRYNDREIVRAIAVDMLEAYDFIQEKGVVVKDMAPVLVAPTDPESVPRQTYADPTGWDDYYGSPTVAARGGVGVTRPQEETLRESGAQFLLNYHMDRIYRDFDTQAGRFTGRVLGIQASYKPTVLPDETERLESLMGDGNVNESRSTVNIKANKAVIVTTGGGIGNLRYRTMFDPRLGPEYDGIAGMPFSDKDASGEYAAMAIGGSLGTLAQMMQEGGFQLAMGSRMGCQYMHGTAFQPASPIWKLARATGINKDMDSLIIVNMLGERPGNEDISALILYAYEKYSYLDAAFASVLTPDENGVLTRYGGPLWAIFDQAAVDRNKWNMEQGDVDYDAGYCFKADTLEELAATVVNKYYEHVKMNPQTLVDTVTRYNGFVDRNKDDEWGKTTLANRIETGPFYAAWTTPYLHDSYGGIMINDKMQAIDIFGEVIPGLYAAGECSGYMRVHGLGRVITAGYIAGKNAAAEIA